MDHKTMNKKGAAAYRTLKSQRVHSVCLLPCWLLKLKGRIDARKGAAVVRMQLRTWTARLRSFEQRFVVSCELALKESREACREAFHILGQQAEEGPDKTGTAVKPADLSAGPSAPSGTDPIAIRAWRKEKAEQLQKAERARMEQQQAEEKARQLEAEREEEAKKLKEAKREASLTISLARETITDVETLLLEKLDKQRARGLRKINAYLTGVKKVLDEEAATVADSDFCDSALELYRAKHAVLDSAVERFADRQLDAGENTKGGQA